MIDVRFPTTDERHLMLPRYTEPEPEQLMLLHTLKLSLPPQTSPRIKAKATEIPKSLLKM